MLQLVEIKRDVENLKKLFNISLQKIINHLSYGQIKKRKYLKYFRLNFVEPTGLEPVSKHIRRKLSTCLFLHWFSKKYRGKTNQYFS